VKDKYIVADVPMNYFGKDLEAMTNAVHYQNWIVKEFRPYVGNIVAEVGAGNGNLSSLFLSQKIEKLYAFEPSLNMYNSLQKRLNGNAKVNILQACFSEKAAEFQNFFDVVFYINVLEHIENDLQELSIANSCLKNKGYIGIFVPALDCLYSGYDKKLGHLRRYTKNRLMNLAREAGFDIVKARYFDVAGILPWYINFVLLNKNLTGKNVMLYDNVVVPIMRIVEGLIPPPVGKSLLLVGWKR
jgi:SAM-dependent methyltransferase